MRHTYIRDVKCDTPGCDTTQARLYAYCCSDIMHQKCPKCGAEKTLDRFEAYGILRPLFEPPYNTPEEKAAADKYYHEVYKPASDKFYKHLHHTGIAELGFLGEQDARPQFGEAMKKVFPK